MDLKCLRVVRPVAHLPDFPAHLHSEKTHAVPGALRRSHCTEGRWNLQALVHDFQCVSQ